MNQTLTEAPTSRGTNIADHAGTYSASGNAPSTLTEVNAENPNMIRREAGASKPDPVRSDPTTLQDDPEAREEVLDSSIKALWSEHATHAEHSKRGRSSNAALKKIRSELGERLAELKQMLCVVGRSSGWAAKCEELGIAKKTADRYVAKHLAKARELEKDATGALSKPLTEVEIRKLARDIARRVSAKLDSSEALSQFLEELGLTLTSNPVSGLVS